MPAAANAPQGHLPAPEATPSAPPARSHSTVMPGSATTAPPSIFTENPGNLFKSEGAHPARDMPGETREPAAAQAEQQPAIAPAVSGPLSQSQLKARIADGAELGPTPQQPTYSVQPIPAHGHQSNNQLAAADLPTMAGIEDIQQRPSTGQEEHTAVSPTAAAPATLVVPAADMGTLTSLVPAPKGVANLTIPGAQLQDTMELSKQHMSQAHLSRGASAEDFSRPHAGAQETSSKHVPATSKATAGPTGSPNEPSSFFPAPPSSTKPWMSDGSRSHLPPRPAPLAAAGQQYVGQIAEAQDERPMTERTGLKFVSHSSSHPTTSDPTPPTQAETVHVAVAAEGGAEDAGIVSQHPPTPSPALLEEGSQQHCTDVAASMSDNRAERRHAGEWDPMTPPEQLAADVSVLGTPVAMHRRISASVMTTPMPK